MEKIYELQNKGSKYHPNRFRSLKGFKLTLEVKTRFSCLEKSLRALWAQLSAAVARRERYLLRVFFKTYNISQAPAVAGTFNGITKDMKKERFHPNDFPMLIRSGKQVSIPLINPFGKFSQHGRAMTCVRAWNLGNTARPVAGHKVSIKVDKGPYEQLCNYLLALQAQQISTGPARSQTKAFPPMIPSFA